MTKEVAIKNETSALASSDALSILEQFAGEGFGDISASDFNIPRIGIIGDLSPQIKKNDASYIEGAEPGHFVDVGFGELFKDGIEFLPVIRKKEWIRWRPRKTGEGIVARYDYDFISENGLTRNDRNEYIVTSDGSGDEIIETWQFYGLNISAGGRRSFLPLKKSNLKIGRRWFGQLAEMKLPNGKPAPLFMSTWNLGSFTDSSNGNSWYNFTINKGRPVTELENAAEIVQRAADFLKQVESGSVQGQDEREEATNANSSEVPF